MATYTRDRYHSHRSSKFYPNTVPSGHVGIELEVEALQNSTYLHLLTLLPDISSARRPIVEEDSSLSLSRGMEIVFPPFSPRQLRHKNGAVSKVMDSLRGRVVEGADRVGMHYNYSAHGWSWEKKAAFCAIIHNLPRGFLRELAARNPEGYEPRRTGLSAYGYRCGGRQFCGNRDSRIEVRFFGSTTSTYLMRLRLDFLTVVEAASENCNWDDAMFREFRETYNQVYNSDVHNYYGTALSNIAAASVASSLFSSALASMKGKKWAALRRVWKETT